MYRIHYILLLPLFMVASSCLALQLCKSLCNGLIQQWVNTFHRRWKPRCLRWQEVQRALQRRLGRAATLRQPVSICERRSQGDLQIKERDRVIKHVERQHLELERKQKRVCQDLSMTRGRTKFHRIWDFTSRNILLGPRVCCPANHYQITTTVAQNSCSI